VIIFILRFLFLYDSDLLIYSPHRSAVVRGLRGSSASAPAFGGRSAVVSINYNLNLGTPYLLPMLCLKYLAA